MMIMIFTDLLSSKVLYVLLVKSTAKGGGCRNEYRLNGTLVELNRPLLVRRLPDRLACPQMVSWLGPARPKKPLDDGERGLNIIAKGS